jgi:hypothetical protein
MVNSSSWVLATILVIACTGATLGLASPAAAAEGFPPTDTSPLIVAFPHHDAPGDRGVDRAPSDRRDAHPYEGVYGRADVLGAAFGMKSQNACETAGSCSASGTYGAWMGLRVGYAFGWLGVEAGGVVLGDLQLATGSPPSSGSVGASRDAQLANAARTPHYFYYGVGGLIGAGPRFTTKGRSMRLSFGVLPGVTIRNLGVRRQTGPDAAVTAKTDAAFGVTADAGVLLGATPGLRVYLGLMAWADFANHSGTTTSGNGVLPNPRAAVPGQQVYLGPVLGFGFGH